MPWTFATLLQEHIDQHPEDLAALTLKLEVDRLGKQECAYCDGFGHSKEDCATNKKLTWLRASVKDQADYVNAVRRKLVAEKPQGEKEGFSKLTGDRSKLFGTVPNQFSFKKRNMKFSMKS